jgi:hypothetical protein
MEPSVMLAAAGFLLNLFVVIVGGAIGLGRVEGRLLVAMERHRREFESDVDQLRREIGETIHGVRQKMVDMELWNRDTFLRRESFFEIMKGLNVNMENLGNKLEARLLRMENKLDGIRVAD